MEGHLLMLISNNKTVPFKIQELEELLVILNPWELYVLKLNNPKSSVIPNYNIEKFEIKK